VAEISVCGGLTSNVTIIPSIILLLSTTLLLMPENSQFILGKPFQEIKEMLSSGLRPAMPLRLALTCGL
jgi:hypothetical protein